MTNMKQMIAEYFNCNETGSITRGQLRKEMSIEDNEQSLFQKAIKELEKEGLLHAPKKGKIHGIKRHTWVIGRLNVNPKGFGFVVNREEKKAIFIPKDQINEAMHKDMVVAKITKQTAEMNNPEGVIVSILEHELKRVVGTYQESEGFGFLVPDDPRIQKDIYIPVGCSLHAKNNDKVVVVITEYPKRNRKPVGHVEEVIGLKGDKDVELLSILKEKGISYEFPTEVIDQASKMKSSISTQERESRIDLTDKIVFTIDGEDAKDLDDAISIEKKENGHYLLGVHIADVTHFVKENTPIDREALQRGTSVYLIDTVIPMLPKELSNELCSLQPDVEKLALSVIMEINQQGIVVHREFYESIILSKARLTYQEATKYLEGENPEFLVKYPFLKNEMEWLKELTLRLQAKREERGSIEFHFEEAKVILDEEGKVTEVKPYERGIANDMIEESMLICNETVAEYFSQKEIPFVFRNHSDPREERMSIFESFIEPYGYKLSSTEEILPKELQLLLVEAKGTKEEKAIHLLLLRSMMQARYSPECKGHFGLATSFYTHFTSPIRRYPDLQIHRILKEYLHKKLTPKRKEMLKEIVRESSSIASRKERISEQAEYEYKQLKKVEWMESKIGEQFDATVIDVSKTALTVELKNTVEGKILHHHFPPHTYQYIESSFTWIHHQSGESIQIGDELTVVVKEANSKQREVLFDMVAKRT